MEVIIDGAKGFEVPADAGNVVAVLGVVGEQLSAGGRAMVGLAVDGETLTPEQVGERLANKPLAEVGELSVTSRPLLDMVNECLAELREVVPELPVVCRELAAVFQGETPDEGFEPFQELALVWGNVKLREKLVCEALGLDAGSFEVGGQPAEAQFKELNDFLEEAVQALKDGDTVLLGDLLEYELAPRAEQEAGLVALLAEQVPAKTG